VSPTAGHRSGQKERPPSERLLAAHVIGMRWAEWTEGGRVLDDIVEDLMAFLGRALPPHGGS